MNHSDISDIRNSIARLGRKLDERGPRAGRSPGALFAKALACRVFAARTGGMTAASTAAELYPNDREVLAALDTPGLVTRTAVSPAMTSVSGWASELSVPAVLDPIQIIAPASAYSQLSARPSTIRVSLAGHSAINIPSRAPTPTLAGPFIGEGLPIPVRKVALATAPLAPKKCAVISTVTEEMINASRIETLLRTVMANDTAAAIDAVLVGNGAVSATSPPGLLAGLTPIAGATGGGAAAFAADMRALSAAIATTGPLIDPVLLLSAARVFVVGALLAQGSDMPIIYSPAVADTTAIMLDAANFASGEGDSPTIVASRETAVHEEDTTPLPLSTGVQGSGVVAVPMRSLYQTDAVAIRLVQRLSWTMTRSGRVAFSSTITW